MYGNSNRGVQYYLFGSGIPVTMILIAVNILTFFIDACLPNTRPAMTGLAFSTLAWPQHFWTLLTWPLVGLPNPINVLFACLWAYWVCGSLERSWGTRTFLGFFAATVVIMGISVWIGSNLLRVPSGLIGLFFAVAAPTIAWCTINRREVIKLYAIIPIPAPLLGWLTVVVVWFELGTPIMGLFGLTGLAAAYWYATSGRYAYRGYSTQGGLFSGGGGRSKNTPPLRMVSTENETTGRGGLSGWLQSRKEQRELKKLWKRSIAPDPKEKDGRG